MENLEKLNELITELGPLLTPDSIIQLAPNQWQINVPGTQLCMQYVADSDSATLYSELTPINEDERLAMYQAMLCYNAQFAKTGGVTLGLIEPDGNGLMMLELPLANLTLQHLISIILRFVEKQQSWTLLLSEKLQTPSQIEQFDHQMPFDGVRV
ncbi:type III secretion system chaperone [Pseudoalteromonas spongiae]|uniref:type III secretion system chaperone n=1 Tax=Pseudoalteromonas spongiae TaxID=298657 RepID=UPI000C2D5146|nr:type III secretion system chaperone [Pseudoalteromonas spongiae]